MKKIETLFSLIMGCLIFMGSVLADQYHPASEIIPGDFRGTKNDVYSFPGNLYIKGSGKLYLGNSYLSGLSAGGKNYLQTEGGLILGSDLTVGGFLQLQPLTTQPPAFNGRIYYDSSSNKLRCYENGAWKDCISSGSGSSYWVPSDVKMTSTTHNGKFVTGSNGYQDMKTWIQSNGCSGYHVCSASELTAWAQNGGMLSGYGYCWYNSGVMDISESGGWYNDCDGWANGGSSFGGNLWQANTPRLVHISCDQSFPVCCCK